MGRKGKKKGEDGVGWIGQCRWVCRLLNVACLRHFHLVTCLVLLSFLPERDYVTFGSLLSQFRLSVVCRLSV